MDLSNRSFLASFVAHENSPLFHLTFDPSGTLLVTADRDGQYLNIYQVIGYPIAPMLVEQSDGSDDDEDFAEFKNNNNQPNLTQSIIGGGQQQTQQHVVYKHLYRVFRGYTFAFIRVLFFCLLLFVFCLFNHNMYVL